MAISTRMTHNLLPNNTTAADRCLDRLRRICQMFRRQGPSLPQHEAMAGTLTVTFSAGAQGDWQIERIAAVIGESLPPARRLSVLEGAAADHGQTWQLRGVVSNPRYSTASELKQLVAVSPPLGRPEATVAALIPIRKSETWWTMGQDERRAIFEESSKHIARSMNHLPAVARRLHHSRDLGEAFDFLSGSNTLHSLPWPSKIS